MAQKPELFGTDGIRGVAGKYPLDPATVWSIGRAISEVVSKAGKDRVLLGEDTRESSSWISRTLAAGLKAGGAEATYAGVITTPGVAYLTRRHGFAAGIVVSASHNPYQDNGIKVLSSSGMKLSESTELEIESALRTVGAAPTPVPEMALELAANLLDDYVGFLASLLPPDLRRPGGKLVADCAHGAASRVAPALFQKLGLEAEILHAEPTGRNINAGCGSLHPERMASATKSRGARLGVAFDGDADRAIFATHDGRLADGDHVLYSVAPFLHQRGLLKGGAVVGTLMTNLGLEVALARQGIGVKRTAVGDKYVLEEMLRSGLNLGGEPSGHIIFADQSLAGDGFITLLQVLKVMEESSQPLEELVRGLQQFPQLITNVRVREKRPLESIPEVARAIARCREEMGERGRVVVRYSGTEALARVMVEGEQASAVQDHAARIAGAIEAALGAP